MKVVIATDGEIRVWDFVEPEDANKAFKLAYNAVYDGLTNNSGPGMLRDNIDDEALRLVKAVLSKYTGELE